MRVRTARAPMRQISRDLKVQLSCLCSRWASRQPFFRLRILWANVRIIFQNDPTLPLRRLVDAARAATGKVPLAPPPPASPDDRQFSNFVGSRFEIEPDE